jgi:hypothetical protein
MSLSVKRAGVWTAIQAVYLKLSQVSGHQLKRFSLTKLESGNRFYQKVELKNTLFQVVYTFTVPPGVFQLTAYGAGGGGSGGGGGEDNRGGGGGGGSGGYVQGQVLSVVPGQVLNITIGSGGVYTGPATAPGTDAVGTSANGSSGTATTVAGFLTLNGGAGGTSAGNAGGEWWSWYRSRSRWYWRWSKRSERSKW